MLQGNFVFTFVYPFFTDFTFVNGLLKINSVLDYETATTVSFTISAYDGKNTTTARVYIKVKPVNEFSPMIHLNDSDIDVTENTNMTFQFQVSKSSFLTILILTAVKCKNKKTK